MRRGIGRESDENLIESDVDSTSVVVFVAAWATYLDSCVDPFVVIDTEYEYLKSILTNHLYIYMNE